MRIWPLRTEQPATFRRERHGQHITQQLYVFAQKVDGKMYGRSLFISVNGFSNESIKAVVHGKHIQTILTDGEDLSHVLVDRSTLEVLLDYKVRAAQTRGEVYVCGLRRAVKI